MKSVSLVVAVVALVGVACGDSGSAATPDSGTTGGIDGGNTTGIDIPTVDSGNAQDSAVPDRYPMCDRPKIDMSLAPPEPYGKAKPWTMAQVTACQKLCPDVQFKCVADKCENGNEFVDCYISETSFCATDGSKAPCKAAFENIGCCAVQEKCFDTNDAFNTCTGKDQTTGKEGVCFQTSADFAKCANADATCGRLATKACIDDGTGPKPDAGTADAAAGDGGTLSFELGNKWLMDLPRQLNGTIRLPER